MRRIVTLLLLAGCTPPDVSPAEQSTAAIMNGMPVPHASRPAAVFLTFPFADGAFHCTGTLIAPDLVLTAGHCTVCASSGVAYVLGEGSGAPGTPPLLLPHSVTQVFTHPDAMKAPVNCAQSGQQVSLELNFKTDSAHDLGLVRLGTPSAVTPAKVLLVPPLGFSPVQDLFGQQLPIIGRGETCDGCDDATLMREGTQDLTSYQPEDATCGAADADDFTLHTTRVQGDSESLTQSGDSGGPMLATVGGLEQIIAVDSRGNHVTRAVHTPTFTRANALFIHSELFSSSLWSPDQDDDDVIDYIDNCVFDANTDQLDRDLDGHGDVCDNCTPRGSNAAPLSLFSFTASELAGAPFSNPLQQNTNAEAEDAVLLAADPTLIDANGNVRRISAADYRRSLGDDGSCPNQPLDVRQDVRRGDSCDPIPSLKTEATLVTLPPADFGVVLAGPCAVTGSAIGTCSYHAVGGFKHTGLVEAPSHSGQVGLRHCACAAAHDTPAERRLNCAASPYQCQQNATQYTLSHPRWRMLDLDGADATGESLVSLTFPDGTGAVAWDYLADLLALTGASMLPSKPWAIADDGSLVGGPKLKGVLWSHVTHYDGQAVTSIADVDGRNVAALANRWGDGDHRFMRKTRWKKIPRYEPARWWEYCAMCGLLDDQSWVTVVNDPLGRPAWAIALGPNGGTDVTSAVDAAALGYLSSASWQLAVAAESEARLVATGIDRRGVVFRHGTLEVQGRLSLKGGKLLGAPVSAPRVSGLGVGEVVVTTYSANLDGLFALRQPQQGAVVFEQVLLGQAAWRRTPLSARLGTPIAALWSAADDALLVLDRQGTAVRLSKVSREGHLEVLAPRLLDGSYSGASLSHAPDGSLLLAAADARLRSTVLAHLRLPEGRTALWLVDRATHANEQLAGAAQQSPGGSVQFLVPVSGGFEPRSLAGRAFQRVDAEVRGPLF